MSISPEEKSEGNYTKKIPKEANPKIDMANYKILNVSASDQIHTVVNETLSFFH